MTNARPPGPEPPTTPSTASHAQMHDAQHQQEPQRKRERVSREEADRRSAGEPAARLRSSPSTTSTRHARPAPDHPARPPPACLHPPPVPLHPSTASRETTEAERERGEERTGKGRAVAPHRPQFSRQGHNIANHTPTRPSPARRRPAIVRQPSPRRLPPAVNSAFGEFAEPQPETGDSRRENSPRPADHAPPAPGEPSHFRVAGNS